MESNILVYRYGPSPVIVSDTSMVWLEFKSPLDSKPFNVQANSS